MFLFICLHFEISSFSLFSLFTSSIYVIINNFSINPILPVWGGGKFIPPCQTFSNNFIFTNTMMLKFFHFKYWRILNLLAKFQACRTYHFKIISFFWRPPIEITIKSRQNVKNVFLIILEFKKLWASNFEHTFVVSISFICFFFFASKCYDVI